MFKSLSAIGLVKPFAAAALAAYAMGSVAAHATVYTVDAITPPSSWLDTGIDASPGITYDFTVLDPSTLWSAGTQVPYNRKSTANGIPPTGGYGVWTMFGYTFNYGALVGEDSGKYFLIGKGPTILSGLSGEIKVGYWDSYYSDNSGTQTLSVTTVPEVSTWAMMLVGFAGLGFASYRRAKNGRNIMTFEL